MKKRNSDFWTFLLLLFGHVASGILLPQPGMEPVPGILETWSLNHWTASEVSGYRILQNNNWLQGNLKLQLKNTETLSN